MTTERLAGATRYGTAAAIAGDEAFASPATAIVATGENFPDALAASTLAGASAPAPIVLTQTNTYTNETFDTFDTDVSPDQLADLTFQVVLENGDLIEGDSAETSPDNDDPSKTVVVTFDDQADGSDSDLLPGPVFTEVDPVRGLVVKDGTVTPGGRHGAWR